MLHRCPSDSSGVTALKLAVLLPANVGMINSLTPVKAGTALWWLSDCGSPPRLCLEVRALQQQWMSFLADATFYLQSYRAVVQRLLTMEIY